MHNDATIEFYNRLLALSSVMFDHEDQVGVDFQTRSHIKTPALTMIEPFSLLRVSTTSLHVIGVVGRPFLRQNNTNWKQNTDYIIIKVR